MTGPGPVDAMDVRDPPRPRKRSARVTTALAMTAVVLAAGGIGIAALLAPHWSTDAPSGRDAVSTTRNPVWTAGAWPFAADPWGKGKAFHCRAEHCGAEVVLYLRAKIGLCGCVTSIDDDSLELGSDLDLIATERTSAGPGRPIAIRWMKGRSRLYAVGGTAATARSAVAVVFHERCDMIVATAAVGDDQPARQEAAVIDFLNSDVVLRWAEVTLGL